jgi:PAS domain S-box-containing protein
LEILYIENEKLEKYFKWKIKGLKMKNKIYILINLISNISFKKIQFRITFLIWVIIIFSVLVYLAGTIPFQRSAALERMNNEATDIVNSISQVTTTAIISEDYSFAVDHCLNVVRQSKSLDYVIITKKDGFSLIHQIEGWKIDTLHGYWKPTNLKNVRSEIQINQFSKEHEVFNFSTPFSYSGINWGWIHIGLSLKKYNSDNDKTTSRSILLAFICIIIGLIAAYFFTKKLILPIKLLDIATKKVTDGDLNVRADIKTGDELQSLGDSFNKMTEAILKSRNEIIANTEFINNIIKSLNDTLIVCDTAWRISKVNLATKKLLGYSEEELLHKTIDLVFDIESAYKFKNNFMDINYNKFNDNYYNDELNYISKSNQIIPVLFSSSVVLANDFEPVGYVIIALDITERKKAEIELRTTHDQLELRVVERTIELENVNSALLSEIKTRRNAEEKIKASLQEKEVLLKEIHHRVKNNLQVISSLLYLQSKKIEIKEYKDIFNESQNRIKSMALVHENLYKSDNLAGIALSDYISSLINYLMRTYNINFNKIKQKINIDNIILSIDKSIPFGLIINELITNCLKYAFTDIDDGQITVEIKKLNNGNIYLSILDNGIGMPVDFDINKSNSLGLKLVQTLVEQLEGTFQWHSDCGTEFEIEFSNSQKGKYENEY